LGLDNNKLKERCSSNIGSINWHRKKLLDIGSVITGKTPPTKEAKYWNGGKIPFITPSDISDFTSRYLQSIERSVSGKWEGKSRKYLLPKNTICFVCIGSTIGKMCLTREDSFTNQQINSITTKCEFDPMFIFYALRNSAKEINRIYGGGGAAKAIINKTTFENIEICVPDSRLEQQAITKILSDLDEKIELNNQMNKTLEAIAQAIFKRWFIDFEFPNEYGKPYKSGRGGVILTKGGDYGW
jgi:type I restriction enzyme S subunit